RRRFPGRLALLRLCAMTLILPVLVAVFGILSVYGRQGWLASLPQSGATTELSKGTTLNVDSLTQQADSTLNIDLSKTNGESAITA
ncbi:hypothetical protein ONQ97_25770, partial [Salmonella enterica subsp. enterica serovar Virginia]|nr:hypothetical protein [Salmonella enterica subsp. enterica serovar Virginia]